jgi:putative CocE/NonD family hydrolase
MRSTVAREGSQPTHEIRYLHDQKAPMRDGVRLSADIILPQGPGPFPALLHRTPYESNADRWITWAKWFARRGYAAVSQDCRGRYESEGTFYAYRDDGRDGHDTLEWIAAQPWCDGKIGTWGRSYGAIAQWQMAPLDSPHLACMAPHAICDDYFADYHYVGGAFQLTLSIMAAICFTTSVSLTTQEAAAELFNTNRFIRSLPIIDMDVRAIGKEIPFWRDWLAHPTNDDYWKALATTGRFDRIDVPIFQQSGWYDAYANSHFDHFAGMTTLGKSERARRNQKLLMGPWSHGVIESSKMGEIDFGPSAFLNLSEIELRWYDYWH